MLILLVLFCSINNFLVLADDLPLVGGSYGITGIGINSSHDWQDDNSGISWRRQESQMMKGRVNTDLKINVPRVTSFVTPSSSNCTSPTTVIMDCSYWESEVERLEKEIEKLKKQLQQYETKKKPTK